MVALRLTLSWPQQQARLASPSRARAMFKEFDRRTCRGVELLDRYRPSPFSRLHLWNSVFSEELKN